MAKHYRLSVHDLNGNKLCTLYDSRIEQIGSAKSIKITKEIEGWKEIEFTISKRDAEGNRNYRFDYLKNENLLYLYENGALDVYCIKAPSKFHSSGKVQVSVICNHLSEELKAKNLFKYFDDENGIDTCENLIQKAIAGTGWTLIACDKFFESDGVTEKIRSYKCDTKTGAWNMIAEICKLFKAHPIFHGADRTIEIRSNDDSTGWKEILFGKNSDKLTRTEDSSNMISRLYVEGEYGDYGYVGIDSVNPTGLPFLLNFDYYKELGVFTDKHQAAVDKYLNDYKENSTLISESTSEILKETSSLSELIGTCEYVYYPVINGAIDMDSIIHSNGIENAKTKLNVGDRIAIVAQDGSYSYGEYANDLQLNGVICVFKFIPTITGTMAAHEDIISSSSDSIERYLEELNKFLADEGYATVSVSDLHSIYSTEDLSVVKSEGFNTNGLAKQYALNTTLEYVYSIGMSENVVTASYASLNEKMLQVIDLVQQIDDISKVIEIEIERQGAIDNEFSIAMGVMLRDGYWSDDNYTIGQEEFLYKDALDMAAIVCRPTVTYSIDTYNLSVLPEFADESFELGNTVRIYEPELGINDYAIVSKTVEWADRPTSDTATLKTDLLDIGAKTFSTVLERVTELAEQVRQNRDIYQRAVAISKDGTINSNLLNGAIDVLKTRLLSTSSNWTTDDKGNIIFTALDGSSAMMLCGGGFMIANTKKANGEWNWRTFGTGEGFTADLIVAGFINAERIQAHTITVDHLASNVGESLDLSSNESVRIAVENASLNIGKETIIATVRESDEYKADLAALEVTPEKIETLVENSKSIASIKTQADKIDLVVEGEDSQGKLILTDELLEAVAGQIDLRANESISLIVGSKAEIFRGEKPPVDGPKDSLWIQPGTGYIYQLQKGDTTPVEFWIDDTGILYYTFDGEIVYDLRIDDNGELCISDTAPFIAILNPEGMPIWWCRVKDSEITKAQTTADSALGAAQSNNALIIQQGTKIEQTQEQITFTAERVDRVAASANQNTSDIGALATRVSAAEQKITPDAIVSTVRSSTSYTSDISGLQQGISGAQNAANAASETAGENATNIGKLVTRMDSAEQKITATAITSTVRSSTEYTQDIADLQQGISGAQSTADKAQENVDKAQADLNDQIDVAFSEIEQTAGRFEVSLSEKVGKSELRTYMRYEDGILELGRSDSRYTTRTSDSGFEVLQDNAVMASMVQNTVSAPVVNAQRMFTIGDSRTIRLGASGHLIFN